MDSINREREREREREGFLKKEISTLRVNRVVVDGLEEF